MEAFAGISFLFGLIVMGISFSLVILAFSAYFRIKGIERAMWAVVSQLQALRAEHPATPVSPGKLERLPDAVGEHHVANSMFGR